MKSRKRTWLEENWRFLFPALTILYDSLIIICCLGVGYAINFDRASMGGFFSHQWKLVAYTLVLYIGLSSMVGVYRQSYTSSMRLQMAAALRAYAIGTLIIFATLFLFRNTYYSRGVLLTYVVLVPAGFCVGRIVLDRLRTRLQKAKWALEPAVIVVADDNAREQLRDLATYPSIGFDVQRVLDISAMDVDEARKRISDVMSKDTCLICASSSLDSPRLNVLEVVSSAGATIRLVSPEIHDALTRTRLYDFAGILLSNSSGTAGSPAYRLMKRAIDLVVSLLAVVVTLPVLVLLSAAIRMGSRGSIFFRQVRSLTPQSTPVRVLKFRSMRTTGPEYKESANGGNGWNDVDLSKSPDDPRITRVGRWIRKYSLDELPQLFNVIAGEMSLVGPRPLPEADFNKLTLNWAIASMYRRRSLAKPGLTGVWQVSGRSRLSLVQMMILDLYYAENQTFLFDLEILLETIPAVISGRGAY
jgi:exopolysaccharide biosynthesis polyprenyl glycosylphosphotransferase